MANVKLYLGDSRDILTTIGPVDTVITDPVWPNAPADMFPDVADAAGLLADCLKKIEAKRIVIVLRGDSDPRFLQAVPARWPFFRVQLLPYVMPGYIGRKLGGDELAYCFGEPLPSAPGRRVIPGRAPAAQPVHRKANGHPCSRALIHFEWLVNWWSLPGETVVDPFMGSGTTGVACVHQQRNFIGIEINENWFSVAEKHISEASFQKPLLPNNGLHRTGELRQTKLVC
jgi:site-specific DNA-methyltransferase (adenine-specific)